LNTSNRFKVSSGIIKPHDLKIFPDYPRGMDIRKDLLTTEIN
jgi:hypothetical protein